MKRIFVLFMCLMFTNFCFGDDFSVVSGVLDDQRGDVLAAFGDFNADKLIDVFVINYAGQGIDVLLAQEKKQYERRTLLTNESIPSGSMISGLMTADFDGDMIMDVLVSTMHPTGSGSHVRISVFWGNGSGLDIGNPYRFDNTSLKDEPVLFDFNSDMIPDLLTWTAEDTNEVWLALPDQRNFSRSTFPSQFQLAVPHSSAFIDLDGDYNADLLLTSINNTFILFSENSFNNSTAFEVDHSVLIGQSSFADFNQDGYIDQVVPACKLSPDGVCLDSFIYLRDGKNKTQWLRASEPFVDKQFVWKTSGSPFSLHFPVTLRVGDYDMDGYPDLLAVLNSSTQGSMPYLLRNTVNSTGEGRKFDLQRPLLSTPTNSTLLATFFDYGEDGMPDILITVTAQNGEPYSILLRNNLALDTCFLKVTVITGLCLEKCKKNHKPYGVNVPGPMVVYETTQTNGYRQTNCAGQLAQSAHFALQLPFVSFGLGQTPNFVDKVWIGVPQPDKNKVHRVKLWTQIIPNAQLIVTPNPLDDPPSWRMQLFVVPSQQIYLTGIALLTTCVLMALIVGVLLWNERSEDKREKKNESQKFHFDAM